MPDFSKSSTKSEIFYLPSSFLAGIFQSLAILGKNKIGYLPASTAMVIMDAQYWFGCAIIGVCLRISVQ